MTKPEDFDTELFKKGLEIRREVLGKAHVDRSLQSIDEFTGPIQKLVTEWCWGEIWGRPGLPRKTRSIMNLAMLAALNRPHEVKLHVRGAINNGVTKEEIQEVLMQVAIYCGVPAALDSMRVCVETLREIEAQGE